MVKKERETGLRNRFMMLTQAVVASAGLLMGGKAVAQNVNQQTNNQQAPQVQQLQEQIKGVFRQQIKETNTIIRWSVTDNDIIYKQTEIYDENGNLVGLGPYSKYGKGYVTTMANPQLNYRTTNTEARDKLNRKLMRTTTGQDVAIGADKEAYLPDTRTKVKLTYGEKRHLTQLYENEVTSQSMTQHNLNGTSETHDTFNVTGMDGQPWVLVVIQKFEPDASKQPQTKLTAEKIPNPAKGTLQTTARLQNASNSEVPTITLIEDGLDFAHEQGQNKELDRLWKRTANTSVKLPVNIPDRPSNTALQKTAYGFEIYLGTGERECAPDGYLVYSKDGWRTEKCIVDRDALNGFEKHKSRLSPRCAENQLYDRVSVLNNGDRFWIHEGNGKLTLRGRVEEAGYVLWAAQNGQSYTTLRYKKHGELFRLAIGENDADTLKSLLEGSDDKTGPRSLPKNAPHNPGEQIPWWQKKMMKDKSQIK